MPSSMTSPAVPDRALSQFLLALYREARARDPASFCMWALRGLRQLVPFDSAMWGHGATSGSVELYDVHLVDQPEAMLANYARVRQHDFLARAVGERPGTTVELYSLIDRPSFLRTRMYRLHAKQFGMENLLCTCIPEMPSGLLGVVSVWRNDPDRRFTEQERAAKEFLMPHLVETRRQNVFAAIRLRADVDRARSAVAAVCDRRGLLHEAEEGFGSLMQEAWPGWQGPALPDPLARAVRRGGGSALSVAGLHFTWGAVERRVVLTARTDTPIDALTARERDIAMRLAQGGTVKEVARTLALEPTTVRNHLSAVHRKLGVANRAQLVRALWAAGALDLA